MFFQLQASLFEERERQSDGVKLDAEQKAENSTSACGSCWNLSEASTDISPYTSCSDNHFR